MKTKINISAKSTYIASQSEPQQQKFVWSYEVKIINNSDAIVQLLHRFWRITDMTSHVELIDGPGVIGLQPIIKPGKEFTYTSFCQLMTPQGTMEGQYEMQDLDEQHFRVDIPKFGLSAPASVTKAFRSKLH